MVTLRQLPPCHVFMFQNVWTKQRIWRYNFVRCDTICFGS